MSRKVIALADRGPAHRLRAQRLEHAAKQDRAVVDAGPSRSQRRQRRDAKEALRADDVEVELDLGLRAIPGTLAKAVLIAGRGMRGGGPR